MSVIGFDFGSHTGSMALWFEEKDTIEVIADDLGSRTIPCAVAFRGDEIIVGQSAMSQQHKNAANTFEDIRTMLFDKDCENVFVPALDKEISVTELASHYFRNVHNQIKQQVGKVVRECVISVPSSLANHGDAASLKQRLMDAAQAGGIRIKSMVDDSASTLLAYGLDDNTLPASKVIVVDMGWSKTEVSVFNVSGGVFVPTGTASTTEVSGKVFVKLTAEHCAKEYMRKYKHPCSDNSKSMMRLRRECEGAIKALSTNTEATIDIDSLCEGNDFQTKITRARFEDFSSIPFVHLKTVVKDALSKAGSEVESITHVLMSGGFTAVPKAIATLKSLFPAASFPRGRFEFSESQCIGACQHARALMLQGLIDSAPTTSPKSACLSRSIFVSSAGSEPQILLHAGVILPTNAVIKAPVAGPKGHLKLLGGPEGGGSGGSSTPMGEVVFAVEEQSDDASNAVTITVAVGEEGGVTVTVKQDSTGNEIGSLVIA